MYPPCILIFVFSLLATVIAAPQSNHPHPHEQVDINIDEQFPFTSTLPLNEQPSQLPLPGPDMTPDIRIIIDIESKSPVGLGPWGTRNWVKFAGGRWASSWGNGVVQQGGQDNQLILSDLSTNFHATYVMKTNDTDPAYITVTTTGWRTGKKEILEALNDPEKAKGILPSWYKFRAVVSMESGDVRYRHLNTKMWVGTGGKWGKKVVIDGYQL
ncbi:hypothetical protein BZA77DRAFT_355418 [Pyronema omphalodes]|nr:hypothetical protein BZA77DRAFT_355418 [Pyronema omphalodes]